MLVMGPGVRSDYVVRIAAGHMMVEEDDNGGPDRDLDLAATLTTDDDLRYLHFQVALARTCACGPTREPKKLHSTVLGLMLDRTLDLPSCSRVTVTPAPLQE